MATIVAHEVKPPVLEKIDFAKVNQENTELFYKTLDSAKNVPLFAQTIRHGLRSIDLKNPDCIKFLKIHLVFCTHLRLWTLVLQLLHPGCPYLCKENVIFLFHQALIFDQEEILHVLIHHHIYCLRDKELDLMRCYLKIKEGS